MGGIFYTMGKFRGLLVGLLFALWVSACSLIGDAGLQNGNSAEEPVPDALQRHPSRWRESPLE